MSPKPQPARPPSALFEELEDRLLMSVAHHKHHSHAHHNNHTAHHRHSHHHHHIRHHDHILHHDHVLHTNRRGSGGGSNNNNSQSQTGPITLFTLPKTRTVSEEMQKKIDSGLPLFP